MKSILLVGDGGHCKSCIDVIEASGDYLIKGVIQGARSKLSGVLGYPVIGFDHNLPDLLKETPIALITVGQIKSPDTRIHLFKLLKKNNAQLPIIKSPKAHCSPHANIGEGTILMHSSLVNAGAEIGANCIVNSFALVEHDVKVGNHCHIATGVRINGNVLIGAGVFIGSGCTIKEGIRIGSNALIGAGQTVLKDIPAGAVIKA